MENNSNNTIITPDSLKPVEPIEVPTVTAETPNYTGIIGSVSDQIANDYNTYNTQLQNAQQNQNQTASSITQLMADLAGKTQATQQAQEQAGVNTETQNVNRLTEQLLGLNSQASSLNREAQAIPLQIQQEATGRGVTDRGIAPIETARLRDNAIKALSIAQQSDVAQASLLGSQMRLQSAKDKAQQIVDLEFQPKEQIIKTLQTQYDFLKDNLAQVDKKRTESLGVLLKREDEKLASEKANAKAISDMIVQGASQNAPQDLLTRAKNAKTPSEAAIILGQYAGDYYKTELLKQQIATEKAQRAKIYNDMKPSGVPGASPTSQEIKTSTDLQNATSALSLTEGQGKSLAFAQRAINADKALRERLKTYDPTTVFSAGGRFLETDNARAFKRDMADFITAVLRKESGATITEDEFARFIPIYSPQGILTNQKDVTQTAQKRATAIDALISEAGKAAPYLASYKRNNSEEISSGDLSDLPAGSSKSQEAIRALNNLNNNTSTPMTAGYSGYKPN